MPEKSHEILGRVCSSLPLQDLQILEINELTQILIQNYFLL